MSQLSATNKSPLLLIWRPNFVYIAKRVLMPTSAFSLRSTQLLLFCSRSSALLVGADGTSDLKIGYWLEKVLRCWRCPSPFNHNDCKPWGPTHIYVGRAQWFGLTVRLANNSGFERPQNGKDSRGDEQIGACMLRTFVATLNQEEKFEFQYIWRREWMPRMKGSTIPEIGGLPGEVRKESTGLG